MERLNEARRSRRDLVGRLPVRFPQGSAKTQVSSRRRALVATVALSTALLAGLASSAQAVPATSKAGPAADAANRAATAPGPAKLGDAGTPGNDKPAGRAAAEPAPQGILSIIVSLDRQELTLYSDAEPIATSRVSSGKPGHSTPTGVFSVIQKDRWHHSNLYDDAPMFFMQRLTQSGVALHQGVVPNYPASHGCIRLPEAFAQKLWGMTKLGVRVIVTHGDAAPVAISHPRLFTLPREETIAERAPLTPAQLVEAAFNNEVAQLRPPANAQAMAAVMFAQNLTSLPEGATTDSITGTPVPAPRPAPQPQATAPLKAGPISVFISRKEGRLFVRQGFKPMFDVPVTFERPGDAIGTYVFTALAAKDDRASVQWRVVTVPTTEAAKAKGAGTELTPATALDRVTIPADAVERITSLMSAGASLIISDQGLGSETGAGTDFIVLTK
jgi:lipoprotein-anchoring transpeptidase ErfK/SrfK